MPGLGRGLQSLIPRKPLGNGDNFPNQDVSSRSVSSYDGGTKFVNNGILEVSIDSIRPNPRQPREHFSHTGMEELISSVREHGVLQPLVVTAIGNGLYELIAGERRLRASKLAGKETVPVIVRTASEQQKLELALIENLQRQDLSPIEEAKAYKMLIEEYDLTQEEVAKRVGKSRPLVANTLRLLTLPEEVQKAVALGKITSSNARTLAGLSSPEEQKKWMAQMMKDGMTSREAERKVTTKRRTVIVDPQVASDEEALREALGTKVTVEKRGGKGIIAIGFYSDEEYRGLIRRLKK